MLSDLYVAVSAWYFAHKQFYPADGELGQLYITVSANFTNDQEFIHYFAKNTLFMGIKYGHFGHSTFYWLS